MNNNQVLKSGVNPIYKPKYLQPVENDILNIFGKYWFITNGTQIKIAKSYYTSFFLKPTFDYQQMFNLDREVILIISAYDEFRPRDIDAISEVRKNYQALRFEEICSIIISKDLNVEKKINDYLKSNSESQVIVPFSIKEIQKNGEKPNYILNKFRKFFYTRDLFAFKSALQQDLYFFGRNEIVYKLLNRHLSFENSGIFGLRKTGKTSILYAVQRALIIKEGVSVWIDCQDPSVYLKDWNEVLFYIIQNLCKKYDLKLRSKISDYQKKFASEQFSADIQSAYLQLNRKPILLIFDEVERITFDISDADTWRSGENFILFWRALRANFQKLKNVFTYLIASTNPKCVETSTINGQENPIFAQIPHDYIEQFGVRQTKEMVKRLGGYMGISFEEDVYTYLTRDFGGHPFLIRHICSHINETIKKEKPYKINRIEYQKVKTSFESKKGAEYSKMILDVLEQYYPDEFYMLERLSVNDSEFFYEFAQESPQYTSHLIGYGILEEHDNLFDFKIDTLKKYLSSKNKYKKLKLSNEEKQKEISERRNKVEPKLRKIVRTQLKVTFGEESAKIQVLKMHPPEKRRKYKSLAYKDLFDSNKCEIYFDQLRILIKKNWKDCFINIFDSDIQKFESRMTLINYSRKGDSHASIISDSDMQSFRGAMTWLEEKIDDYLN